jgi:predicted metalloenzyme YecM
LKTTIKRNESLQKNFEKSISQIFPAIKELIEQTLNTSLTIYLQDHLGLQEHQDQTGDQARMVQMEGQGRMALME